MMLAPKEQGICLISLSDNADHQTTIYSMFNELYDRYFVFCIGKENPKADNAPFTERNAYVSCPDRPGIGKGTFDLKSLKRIVDLVRNSGCKTIYFESVHLWNALIMLMLGKRFRFVTTIHDVVPHDGSKAVFYCQKLLCKLADTVVIKNRSFLETAISSYGIPRKKLIVFPVWRDYPEQRELNHSGRFLFFGRMKRYKGLDNIVRIIEDCSDINFDVVGAPDQESAGILEGIKELRNANVVDREVDAEEMEGFFSAADWVLLPYESATQSGVIIDAYKFSRPVIAFSVGAVAEQVEEGLTGYLVDPGDISGFIAAVRAASTLSKDDLQGFSTRAYKFGERRYSARCLSSDFVKKFFVKRMPEERACAEGDLRDNY